jgi:hypothetical protein
MWEEYVACMGRIKALTIFLPEKLRASDQLGD